jgi:Na+-transporting methylmalonyl-CoA/oxaloacetate decarboxylase gamma subunit
MGYAFAEGTCVTVVGMIFVLSKLRVLHLGLRTLTEPNLANRNRKIVRIS